MSTRDVSNLNVPGSREGLLAAIRELGPTPYPATTHATVLRANPDAKGMISIIFDQGMVRQGRVGTSNRPVRDGDRVVVAKKGAVWTVTSIITWHGPTPVSPPAAGTPPLVTGSTTVPSTNAPKNHTSVPWSYLEPNTPGSSYSKTWADSVDKALSDLNNNTWRIRQALVALQDAHNSTVDRLHGVRDATSSMNNRLGTVQTSVNSARDVVASTRTTTEQIRAALVTERIVK